MRKSSFLFFAPVFLLLASGETCAQTSVDSRVQVLEETIRALELRVASLEDQLRERPVPTSVASDKANWRKLQKGMSKADVEQLLGSPSRVDEQGFATAWLFGGPADGRVEFNSKGKLESWHEPY